MADVVKLVQRSASTDENGNGSGDVATWLRTLAALVEKGHFGKVPAALVVMREDDAGDDTTKFCLRVRKCNMHSVEVVGALIMMQHDMLES